MSEVTNTITTLTQWNADTRDEYAKSSDVPMAILENEETGEESLNPVLRRIFNGEIVVEVELIAEWRDDKVDCFAIGFKFEAEEEFNLVSFWWAGRRFDADLEKAATKGKLIAFLKPKYEEFLTEDV